MSKTFERTELLLGESSMKKLKNSTVAVFGIGGVGSYVVEALARTGVGNFILVDADKVDQTNINRQLIALNSTVGKNKTDVAVDRIKDINPEVNIIEKTIFFNKKTENEIDFSSVDYIVDAIDSISSKILLCEIANEKNIRIISSMGAGNKLDPTGFKVSDITKTKICPLARIMRKELKKRNIDHLKVVYSEEFPIKNDADYPASIAFVPSVAGLIIASEVVKDLVE